mmetsp:Transcript_15847/g.21356  ORF Transcript_15847/g.21356 Transcript_15847/m.21356 type:complete len:125 (-) Transcript_15847:167-541(-)
MMAGRPIRRKVTQATRREKRKSGTGDSAHILAAGVATGTPSGVKDTTVDMIGDGIGVVAPTVVVGLGAERIKNLAFDERHLQPPFATTIGHQRVSCFFLGATVTATTAIARRWDDVIPPFLAKK